MSPLTLATPRVHVALAAPVAGGLSSAEAQHRLIEFGPNEIRRERTTTPLTLLARQFESPVIWLLLAASVLSAALGERLDALAIGAIVIVNAAIGFFQEHRAERAVAALRFSRRKSGRNGRRSPNTFGLRSERQRCHAAPSDVASASCGGETAIATRT